MFLSQAFKIDDYLTANQVADKWGITRRQVQYLCTRGQIEGAMKVGDYMWIIPKTAEKPTKNKGE